jgi:hypothetical protein
MPAGKAQTILEPKEQKQKVQKGLYVPSSLPHREIIKSYKLSWSIYEINIIIIANIKHLQPVSSSVVPIIVLLICVHLSTFLSNVSLLYSSSLYVYPSFRSYIFACRLKESVSRE